MVLTFYYDLFSQPCRSVWVFLKATGIQFEPKELSLFKGEHKSPEMLKKNPNHKVPLIDDDGFILAESPAIIRYLAVKYKVADHWYPRSDPQKQAKTDEFISWQHHNIRRHEIDTFLPQFMDKMVKKGMMEKSPIPLIPEKVKKAKEELAVSIKHLDEYFIGNTQFIIGNEVSAADIIGACELMQLTGVGEEAIYESNENVKNWIGRVKTRLAPHLTDAMGTIDAYEGQDAVNNILVINKEFHLSV